MDSKNTSTFNREQCPVYRTNQIIGDKWVILILRELFLGHSRFEQFEKNLGISRSVLTTKLRLLLEHGIIYQTDYQDEGQRPRKSYRLSKNGVKFMFVLGSLVQWGNENLSNPEEAQLTIVDEEGRKVRLAFVNEEGRELRFGELRFTVR
jgi:DNA-binding HxlR family transcriptional regulator